MNTAWLKYARFGVLLLLAVLVLLVVVYFHSVLQPFALALFFSYLLSPIISRLNRVYIRKKRVPRGVAILVVYFVFLGGFILGGIYLVPKLSHEVNSLVKGLPVMLKKAEVEILVPLENRLNDWLAQLDPPQIKKPEPEPEDSVTVRNYGIPEEAISDTPSADPLTFLVEGFTFEIRKLGEDRFEVIPRKKEVLSPETPEPVGLSKQVSGLFKQIRTSFENNFLEVVQVSRKYLVQIANSFFTTFLVLMISAFILLDPERIQKFFISLVPRTFQVEYAGFLARLDKGLSGVVRGQVTICLVNGILTGVGIAFLGVPFVFTLSLLATIFSLIPIFGVLISTIPIILMASTVSLTTSALALAWILLIHFLEGNFLNPKILGDASKIHPVLIVFALVVGQYLGGIMGALLAVPVFSLIQNSFLYIQSLAEQWETT